jgi:protein-tyrosine-phosphatase
VRSPLGEAFFRRLTNGLPVKTDSFGTLDLRAGSVLPETLELAHSCFVDVSSHRTRCVRHASLADVVLILGFENQHIREAVVHAQAPRSKVFTLRHFSRLVGRLTPPVEEDVVMRARGLVAQADELRDELRPSVADDMPDPIGGTWKVYRETATEIRAHSLALAAALFGVEEADALLPEPLWRRQPRLRRRAKRLS